MVPQTYPSILNPYTNMREMVVKQLASTSGLQRWVDYIPMKLATSTRPAGEQTTDADGFIAINSLQDTSSGVAFKDWVPVYFDSDATDAWVVSDSGYIPVGASGGAIAILQSFGSDAHVYLPGSTVTSYGANIAPAIDNTWSVTNAGWGNVGSTAVATAVPDGNAFYKTGVVTTGKTYQYTLTVSSISAGAMLVYIGGNGDGKTITAPGTLTGTIQATLNTNVNIGNSGTTTGVVSSLVLREVITTSSVTAGLPTNNYTLSDGSTGYSAVDGTAGLVLDAAGSVGAESITGGTFGNAGDWGLGSGWSVSGNLGVFAGTSAFSQLINTAAVAAIGSTNLVTFTVASAGANVTSVRIVLGGSFSVSRAISGPGTYSVYAVNLGASTSVAIQSLGGSAGAADAFSLSYLSCKPVTGIHATQATTANKPAVRRGLYNLLAQSNDFTGWGKAGAPVVTASTVTRTVTGPTYVQGPAVTKSATAMPYSIIGKFTAGTGRYAAMRAQSIYPNFADAVFDLQNGTVYSSAVSGTFAGQVASIVKSANGECTCCVSFTTDAGTAVNVFASPNSNGTVLDGTDSSATSSFSSGGMAVAQGVWTAQGVLNEGGIPLTTSTAASNPSAGRYSWQFDGSNDSLALGSVPFQMSDDFLIVGAVRFGNPTSWSTVFSVSGATTTPRIEFYCDNANGFVKAYLRDDAGVNVNPGGAVDVRGTSVVATLWKVGTNVYVRVNGVQVATASVSTLGAMTLTGASIGRLFNGTDYMSGSMGQVAIVKGTFSAADVLTLERQVASTFPAAPSF